MLSRFLRSLLGVVMAKTPIQNPTFIGMCARFCGLQNFLYLARFIGSEGGAFGYGLLAFLYFARLLSKD